MNKKPKKQGEKAKWEKERAAVILLPEGRLPSLDLFIYISGIVFDASTFLLGRFDVLIIWEFFSILVNWIMLYKIFDNYLKSSFF